MINPNDVSRFGALWHRHFIWQSLCSLGVQLRNLGVILPMGCITWKIWIACQILFVAQSTSLIARDLSCRWHGNQQLRLINQRILFIDLRHVAAAANSCGILQTRVWMERDMPDGIVLAPEHDHGVIMGSCPSPMSVWCVVHLFWRPVLW